MSYCSVEDVLTYGDIASSADDPLLLELIDRAQKIIEKHTARIFEASANTARTFDAVRDVEKRTLYLDQDLASLNSVTNGDGNAIATSVIVTEPRNRTPYFALTIRSDQTTSWTYNDYPENAISISGKWAYSTTAPDDIVQATVRLATFLYRQRESHESLDRPLLTGDGVTILPVHLPADVLQLLKPYIRVVLA